MRKLIFIIAFLITSFAFAQGGPKVDVIKFRGEVTTTVRNTFNVPTGETWFIYNVTTGLLEYANDNDVWDEVNVSQAVKMKFVTTAQRNALSVDGDEGWIVYNIDTQSIEWADGNNIWYTIQSGGSLSEVDQDIPNNVTRDINLGTGTSRIKISDGSGLSGNEVMNIEKMFINSNRPHSFGTQTSFGVNEGFTGKRWILGKDGANENFYFNYQSTSSSTYGGFAANVATLRSDGTAVAGTDLTNKAYVDGLDHTDDQTFDVAQISGNILELSLDNVAGLTSIDISSADNQTAAEVTIADAGTYTATTNVEDFLQEIASGTIKNTIPTFTGTPITSVMIQTQVQADTDGTPPAGTFVVISDADPIKIETTATFDLSEKKIYNDITSDAATITVSGLESAVELYIYIDRATAPTLAGATFDPIDGTQAFEANIPMIIYGIVHPNKTTINYCYIKL